MKQKKEIYSGTPIENWRIEIVEDSRDVANLLNAAANLGQRPEFEDMLDRARSNGERHLEVFKFKLLGDGTLVRGEIPSEKLYVLQIDLTELTHPGFLARLDSEIDLRKRGVGLDCWRVHGHLKGNDTYIDYLELDDTGNFYLHNQRRSWTTQQTLLARPLP